LRLDRARAIAATALVDHHLAHAAAGRAALSEAEKALLHLDLAAPTARAARGEPRFAAARARPLARRTLGMRCDQDGLFAPERRFREFELERVAQVASARFLRPLAPEQVAEQVLEQIGERAECAL